MSARKRLRRQHAVKMYRVTRHFRNFNRLGNSDAQ